MADHSSSWLSLAAGAVVLALTAPSLALLPNEAHGRASADPCPPVSCEGVSSCLQLCVKKARGEDCEAREGSPVKLRATCNPRREMSIGTTTDLAQISQNTANLDSLENEVAKKATKIAVADNADLIAQNALDIAAIDLTEDQKEVLSVLSVCEGDGDCPAGGDAWSERPAADRYKTLFIEGVNLQVVNGSGSTTCEGPPGFTCQDGPKAGQSCTASNASSDCGDGHECSEDSRACTGTGNVVVGYGHAPASSSTAVARFGSHNVVVGDGHSFSSYAGIVAHNTISAAGASVLAGSDNKATAQFALVGGGHGNQANGSQSAILGGRLNYAGGLCVSSSNGSSPERCNTPSDCCDAQQNAGGSCGEGQTSSPDCCPVSSCVGLGHGAVVAGGSGNQAIGENSWVGGGHLNSAYASGSGVAGGESNQAGVICSLESGGISGCTEFVTLGTASMVLAGSTNRAYGDYASIAGGSENTAGSEGAVVSGGALNSAMEDHATVTSGSHNEAHGVWSVVSGGSGNRAENDYAAVSGGRENVASGQFSSVSGGTDNHAQGEASAVSGGQENDALARLSAISGGSTNTVFSGSYQGSISGGASNHVGSAEALAPNAAVSGGISNSATGENASVTGGVGNTAGYQNSTVGGGASLVTNSVAEFVPMLPASNSNGGD